MYFYLCPGCSKIAQNIFAVDKRLVDAVVIFRELNFFIKKNIFRIRI